MSGRIDEISWDKCTGCCLCQNICPVNAIKMVENSQGFIHPIIDAKICIDCGKCLKSCPIVKQSFQNSNNPECRAVWAQDDIRIRSASGGVFSAVAKMILERGGKVCGAIFDEDFSVKHIVTGKIEDLEKIKSSKYVQSNACLVYKQIKTYLDKGEEVLFSGCPCQVAALYNYLENNDYPNLFTMDIVCHGVPSPLAFRQYLKEKFGDRPIDNIDFRDKTVFGWSSSLNVFFKDGEVYRDDHRYDDYYKAFLQGISTRKACSDCLFSRIPRQGDWTIGDFWGISKVNKAFTDGKGTSLLLINNEKGKTIFDETTELWVLNEEVPLESAIEGNGCIVHPLKSHASRNRFFNNINKLSFDKNVDKCVTHHYDVGIVGLWYGLNYGSILTYYALYCLVNDLGYDALMINKPIELWDSRYSDRKSIANKFIYSHCYVSNIRQSFSDWVNINDHCDSFIVGSDVVWNYKICGRESKQFFFLDFVKDEKKKIAMGSSFGSGYDAPETEKELSEYYLKKFDYIGVREKESKALCNDLFGVNADLVMDPVFICDKKIFVELAQNGGIEKKTDYIFTYILGPDMVKGDAVRYISEFLNLPSINVANPNNPTDFHEMTGLDAVDTPSVEQWISYMMNSNFYIGDSFHGLCFSLIFNIPFLIIVNSNISGLCRFMNLLEMLGLEERIIISDQEDIRDKKNLINKPIDFARVNDIISEKSSESLAWLKKALEGPKVYKQSVQDTLLFDMYYRISKLEEALSNKNI